MGQDASRKKQYVATAIVAAAIVSGIAILIAVTQQQEESIVIEPDPLLQSSGSSESTAPAAESPEQKGQQTPAIDLSPRTSTVEGQVAVQGMGFEPNEGVTVAIENTTLETTPQVVVADTGGNFSAVVTVPERPPGQYEVVASGQEGSSATKSIVIS